MAKKYTQDDTLNRRTQVVQAARWCFLNFGYVKTSFEDIAKRAGLSRTLLYRVFKNKEDIYVAVFTDWLTARHPAAREAANTPGEPCGRFLDVCRLMVLEPWEDMVGAPMGGEFIDVCERVDLAISARHHQVAKDCFTQILGNKESADVVLLALNGFLADKPSVPTLKRRIEILAKNFTQQAIPATGRVRKTSTKMGRSPL